MSSSVMMTPSLPKPTDFHSRPMGYDGCVESHRIAVRAVAVFVTACGLFPDVSGFSGEDASRDAAIVEGGTFCSTVDATFCEDFDEADGGYLGRWTTFYQDPGNTLDTTMDQWSSPPRSLVASVPNATGGAAVWEDLPPGASTIDYAFDIRFEPLDAGANGVLIAQVEVDSFDSDAQYTEYRIEALADASAFQAHVFYPDGGSTSDELPMTAAFTPSVWHHVDMQLVVSPPPTHVIISVDATPSLSTRINDATNGAGPAEFLAGIYRTNGLPGPFTLEIDNVVVNAQ